MQAVYRHAVSDAVRRSAVATPSRHLPCLTKNTSAEARRCFTFLLPCLFPSCCVSCRVFSSHAVPAAAFSVSF